jgi:serine/alanine racemase
VKTETRFPALDRFRLLAAMLVICNHTSPLASYTALGDFWLTRVLARLAVPFFFMVSGYFLAKSNWRSLGSFLKKLLILYGCAILLYLPLNWYGGGYTPGQWLQNLLVEGTFYHLWYFPATILGAIVARQLSRLGLPAALGIAALLYLVGLGGDSYYGLAVEVPALKTLYDGIFTLCGHSRNGLFFAPLFLLLGAAGVTLRRRTAAVGFALSLALLSAEGLWLHSLGVQRHDSMYLTLPVVMLFLFSLLQSSNTGRDKRAGDLAQLVYLIHPWCIVLVRGVAKVVGLEGLFIENSLGHFAAVALSSFCAAALLLRLRPRKLQPKGRAWREVDLDALIHNAGALQSALAPGCRLMAVVKADAYGHGAVPVARALRRAGVDAFAVSCLAEGIALRRKGVRGTILILGCTPPEDAPLLARWHLTQTVADEAHGRALSAQGVPIQVHLALDTGMHRLGLSAVDYASVARMYCLPNLKIRGVFSHLCVSDSQAPEDVAFTYAQLSRFHAAVDWLRNQGLDPGAVHIQSSYGIWNLPQQPCAYARAGIALYGVHSDAAPARRELDLRPVLSLRARVVSVRTVPAGQGAGYGLAFRAGRDTRLAVVSIGYADGLPRCLAQQGGRVLIRGQFCPMAGRMCMDQLLVDVTDLAEAAPGDIVTLIGRDGDRELRAEELAGVCGTITNELLSRMGPRLPVVTV